MGQAAPVGTLVVTAPADSYAVGDVITFTMADRTVTHRIVEVGPDGFTTRRRPQRSPDGWTVARRRK